MNRRGFLAAILATGIAPAIVRADSLMRIVPRQTLVWTPESLSNQMLTLTRHRALLAMRDSLGFISSINAQYDEVYLQQVIPNGRPRRRAFESASELVRQMNGSEEKSSGAQGPVGLSAPAGVSLRGGNST